MELDLSRYAELVEHDGVIGGAFVCVEDEWETGYATSYWTSVAMLVIALKEIISYTQKSRCQDDYKFDSILHA